MSNFYPHPEKIEGGLANFFADLNKGKTTSKPSGPSKPEIAGSAKAEFGLPKVESREFVDLKFEYFPAKVPKPGKDQDLIFEKEEKGAYAVFDGNGDDGQNYVKVLKKNSTELMEEFKQRLDDPILDRDVYSKLWKQQCEAFINDFEKAAKASIPTAGFFTKTELADSTAAFVFLNKLGDGYVANAGDAGVFILRAEIGKLERLSKTTYKNSQHTGGFGSNAQPMYKKFFNVRPGDILLIFSDGLEARDRNANGLEFQTDPTVKDLIKGSPEEISHKLLTKAGAGTKYQKDDISLQVIKVI
jgi:serine/threonine protein phosphatase PrpC